MDLVLSRKIDYYGGIPLCAAATVWRRLTERPRPSVSRERIVIMKFLGIGSIVLAAPLLRHLQSQGDRFELTFVTFRENREVAALLGLVSAENIITVDTRGLFAFLRSAIAAIRALRRLRPTRILDLEFFSRFSALMSFAVGAPHRVGFDFPDGPLLYRGNLYTEYVRFSPHEYTAEAFLRFADSFAPAHPADRSQPDRLAPAFERGDLAELSERLPGLRRPYFLFNINAGELMLIRRWPREKFVALAAKLLQSFPNHQIVCVGSRGERAYVAPFIQSLHDPRVLDVSGRTTLRDLITLCAHADVFITNDSGPMHLAALTPAPMVALFGPGPADIYRPLTAYCEIIFKPGPEGPCLSVLTGKESTCLKRYGRCSCMDRITVDDVYGAVVKLRSV